MGEVSKFWLCYSRKLFFDQLSVVFEAFSHRDVQALLFPDGEDIKTLKVEVIAAASSSGPTKNSRDSSAPDTFLVYCNAKKQPLFVSFDLPVVESAKKLFRNVILPTVYALWKCPNLLAVNFSTVPEVIIVKPRKQASQ